MPGWDGRIGEVVTRIEERDRDGIGGRSFTQAWVMGRVAVPSVVIMVIIILTIIIITMLNAHRDDRRISHARLVLAQVMGRVALRASAAEGS